MVALHPVPAARAAPALSPSVRESWRFTPLSRVEGLADQPSRLMDVVFSPSSLPPGLTLAPVPWDEVARSFSGPHPALPQEGTAWQITVAEGAHVPGLLRFTLPGLAGHTQAAGFLLRLGKGSRLALAQQVRGAGLSHMLIRVDVEDGARLEHARLQMAEETDSTVLQRACVRVGRDATYHHTSLNRGAALSRQEDDIHLMAPGASVSTTSATLLRSAQHGDVTTRIHHEAPHTTSSQIARTVVADEAVGVFQGLIRVAPSAQKTVGQQMSRALLLSDRATMNAKPELEILADDVTCSHGTAIGALSEEALFYLRARGLPEGAARRLLVQGFVVEAFEQAPAELRSILEADALEWLEHLS